MTDPAVTPPPPLSEAAADMLAERVVDRLIDAVADPVTVERVTEAWSGAIDKMLGRGLRRLASTVLVAALLWGAIKFELLGKLLGIKSGN